MEFNINDNKNLMVTKGVIELGEIMPLASSQITGSGSYVRLVLEWSSTKGATGSTVKADLYAQNLNGSYFIATVRNGYSVTIDGSTASGNTSKLSQTANGRALLISHSKFVSYTGNKTISVSGYADLASIYIDADGNGSYETSLGTRSVSGSAVLDFVGSIPTQGAISAPSTGYVIEGSSTVRVSWSAGTSDAGALTYYVERSHNGGAWTSVGNTTALYIDHAVSLAMGDTLAYRVRCANVVGYSGYVYSGTLTANTVSNGTLGAISVYNPYLSADKITFNVAVSGSENLGGVVTNNIHLYYGSTAIATATSTATGNVQITFSATTVLSHLGASKSKDTFRVAIFSTNSRGTRASGENWYDFTVDINSDGGATPTISAITLSGGEFTHPTTCFVAGYSTIGTSYSGTLRRAHGSTTLSYSITLAGQTKTTASASFSGVGAGKHLITATVTDSRGLTASATLYVRVQSYSKPTLQVTDYGRKAVTTEGYVTYTTTFSNIYAYSTNADTQGAQLNAITVQQRNLNNGTWASYTSGTSITGLSNELAYTVGVRVADGFRNTVYTVATVTIPTISSNLSIRRHGLGVNCIPQLGRALDVNGNAYVSGSINGASLSLSGNATVTGTLTVGGRAVNDSTRLSDTANLNDVQTVGMYFNPTNAGATTTLNTPENLAFSLQVEKHAGVKQTWSDYYNTKTYVRSYYNGTWQPWQRVILYSNLLDFVYPVGSIYISANSTSPATFLGGTWVAFSAGRALVGVNGSDADFNAPEKVGGAKTHTLTEAEMPSHTHSGSSGSAGDHNHAQNANTWMNDSTASDTRPSGTTGYYMGAGRKTYYTGNAGAHSHTISIGSSGSGGAHNNMQPYITVYMWKRTA